MRHLTLLLFLSLAVLNFAVSQSTIQSKPTVLTSTEFTAKGPSKETNYYFSFSGGPGEVSVTLKIKATDYSTFARIEVLTAGMTTLATHNMNATTGTGPVQVIKAFELKKKQTIILKLTLDGNLDEYGITLAGKVDIVNTPEDNSNIVSQSGNESKQPITDSPKFKSSPSPTTTTNKLFNIDFSKYKPGQLIKFPSTGLLEIQLTDGSTQSIDLKKIKSIVINKQQQ